MTKISTTHDHLSLPNAGWEIRVALDFGFREFYQGMQQNPTQKPVLLFLPKGASDVPFRFLLGFLTRDLDKDVTCLVEDEQTAMAVDKMISSVATGSKKIDPDTDQIADEAFWRRGRVVIGDLASLAKTDKDAYGACVIIAYGAEFPKHKNPRSRTVYLADKTSYMAQLCGWNAHVLYVEQPFRDAPEYVLAELRREKPFRDEGLRKNRSASEAFDYDEIVLGTLMGDLTQAFANSGRRASFVSADLAGSSESAAASYYIKLFRVSGKGKKLKLFVGAHSYFFADEDMAKRFFRKQDASHACHFMDETVYSEWIGTIHEVNNGLRTLRTLKTLKTLKTPETAPKIELKGDQPWRIR